MGNCDSKEEEKPGSTSNLMTLQNFRFVHRKQSPIYQTIDIFQEKNSFNSWSVLKTIKVANQDVAELIKADLQRFMVLPQEAPIAKPLEFKYKKGTHLCSDTHKFQIVCQYSQKTLGGLTTSRKQLVTPGPNSFLYSEYELWSLTIQLVLAIRAYLVNGVHCIEDLQPDCILIEQADQRTNLLVIKILDPQFLNEER